MSGCGEKEGGRGPVEGKGNPFQSFLQGISNAEKAKARLNPAEFRANQIIV
jgi:hypothetical protein